MINISGSRPPQNDRLFRIPITRVERETLGLYCSDENLPSSGSAARLCIIAYLAHAQENPELLRQQELEASKYPDKTVGTVNVHLDNNLMDDIIETSRQVDVVAEDILRAAILYATVRIPVGQLATEVAMSTLQGIADATEATQT